MNSHHTHGNLSRKKFVSILAGVPLALNMPVRDFIPGEIKGIFPAKSEFDIKGTYLNAAYTHPMSKGSFN